MTSSGVPESIRFTREQLAQKGVPVHEFVLSKDSHALDIQLVEVCRLVELHPLTLEDCRKGNQRAKFEIFPEYIFLVLHHFEPEIEAITELHLVIKSNLIIIVADHPAPGPSRWTDFMQLNLNLSLAQIIHNIFDACVDSAEQRAARIADLINEAETLIVSEKFSPKLIVKLKRNAVRFQRSVAATFPVLREFMACCELSTENELMFRNVLDHQERLRHEIEFIHIDLVALFDVHWGAAGYSTNEQIKRLTLMATLLVPLGFWTSFFGMNFEIMPFRETWFFLLALSLMLGSVVGVLLYLRHRGLFQRSVRLNKTIHQKFK
jgi:magnesium transporter